MKGRPLKHGEPALAYDYRRAIVLVQVLAMDLGQSRTDALYALAEAWEIEIDQMTPMIHDLAKHALDFSHDQVDGV